MFDPGRSDERGRVDDSVFADNQNAVLRLAWEEAREIARMAEYGAERLLALKEAVSQPHFGTGIRTHFWEQPEKLLARLHAIRLYDAALALAVTR